MKKIFLSYPFTGEDIEKLHSLLESVHSKLCEDGNTVFCALLSKEEIDEKGIVGYEARLAYCLEQQKEADIVVALLLSEKPSNGMLQELHLAKERHQPYLLLIRKGLATSFPEFIQNATQVHEYDDTNTLPTLTVEALNKDYPSLC